MLTRNGKNNDDGSFNWKDAIIDAAISGGLGFCTAIGGTAAAGLPTKEMLVAASIAALTQFFLWLAIKRGLRKQSPD